MASKRILLINKSLTIGGIERVLLNQYNTLKNDKHNVDILLFKREIEFNFSDEKAIVYFDQLQSLESFFQTNRYDIVICHAQSERICKKVKVTRVSNLLFVLHGIHSDRLKSGNLIARFLRKKRIQYLYNKQNIVSVSNAVKKDSEIIGIKAKKNLVIYNPLDINGILSASLEEVDEEFSRPYFIWVAEISIIKNLPLLIEIYRYLSMDYDLVIVGDGDREIIRDVEQGIREYNLEGNIHFLGAKINPYPYMKKAKALLMTSKNEGFGMVMMESLLLNVPVFGVKTPSVVELLNIYFPIGILDHEAPYESAEYILKNFNTKVNNKKIVDEFSSSSSNKKYLSYFETFI